MAIRWSKGDYIRLGKAVSDFNRQIAQNTTAENKLYLPKTINYQDLRDNIQTRQGLNAYLQQLKRINKKGAFDLERLEGGVLISKYEKKELERARAQVIPNLERQIAKVEAETLASYGYSPSTQLPNMLKGNAQRKLEATLKDYKELFKLSGTDFKKRAKQLLINQTEKKYRQAYLFRKRYMKLMKENYLGYRDYWIFMKYYANKHKDPVRFYDDLPEDDTYFPNDLYRLSDETFTEEEFTRFVETILGTSVDEIYEEEGLKQGITGEELKIQKDQEAQEKKEELIVRAVNKQFKNLR